MTSNALWDRSYGRVHPWTSELRPTLVVIIEDMFKLVHLETALKRDTWWRAKTKVRTISVRAVRILLECFLVHYNITKMSKFSGK